MQIKFDAFLLNPNALRDSQSLLERALLDEMKKRWAREESPERRPWAPRKQPTGSWPLLRKTGKLQETTKVIFNPVSGFQVRTVPYAVWHQNGTGKLPQRQLFGINKEFIQRAQEILCQKILKVEPVRIR